MTVKAVLFDLDGTLLDTAPDFIRVVNELRQQESLPPLPSKTIRNQVSNGARALVTLAFGLAEGEHGFAALLARLLALYEASLTQETRLFPGMNRILLTLERAGIPWGIVTNKPSRYTEPLLAQLALDQRCAVTICPDHVKRRKPDPEPLLLACRQLQVAPDATVYAGDHQRDVEAGRNAGNKTIAVGWGYLEPGDHPTLWGADYVAQKPEQLSLILSQLGLRT